MFQSLTSRHFLFQELMFRMENEMTGEASLSLDSHSHSFEPARSTCGLDLVGISRQPLPELKPRFSYREDGRPE